jgi:hypothetical protein
MAMSASFAAQHCRDNAAGIANDAQEFRAEKARFPRESLGNSSALGLHHFPRRTGRRITVWAIASLIRILELPVGQAFERLVKDDADIRALSRERPTLSSPTHAFISFVRGAFPFAGSSYARSVDRATTRSLPLRPS